MSLNSSKNVKQVAKIAAISAWVIAGFFAAELGLSFVIGLLLKIGVIQISDIQTPLIQLILSVIAYSTALLVVISPYMLFPDLLFPELHPKSRKYAAKIKEVLGIYKRPYLKNIGWVLLGCATYLALSSILLVSAQLLWHGFNPTQAQDVGFKDIKSTTEIIVAFIALAIIPPFIEELLFRGFLFGKLRQHSNFWVSTLITSLLFGFVHLQWNISLDVFALSLILCALREKTGTIWAGVVLHMLKNSVAFVLLFLHPEIIKNLL